MYGFRVEDGALVWEANYEILKIQAWGKDSLRVQSTRGTHIPPAAWEQDAGLLPLPAQPAQVELLPEVACIRNGKIQAQVTPAGQIQFFQIEADEKPRLLLAEPEPNYIFPPARYFKPFPGDLFHLEARFDPYPGERFYGLGQRQHGLLDQKGCVLELNQRNTEVSIPFALSSRGYGFLWNNPAIGRVELSSNGTRWVAEATRKLDYWITTGEAPAEILEKYSQATGRPPELPEWAAGFWQSKLRYKTQDELLAIAGEYRQRDLPLAVIVIDGGHWALMGDWKFDPRCWPDPGAMVRKLHQMGIEPMVSIWPTVDAECDNFAEMHRRGLFLSTERGVAVHTSLLDTPEGPLYLYHYDPSLPEARQFIWEKVRQNYYRHGIRMFWLDACEPEFYPTDHENLRYSIGNSLEVGCLFPIYHQKAFYDGMVSEGEKKVIILSRSAWAGSQRYGAAVWSGDVPSTFEALQKQVRAGLNMALSGIPWWTTDIGGFHSGDPQSPSFQELIVRWFQYGVFCPLFRLHGFRLPTGTWSGADNEVWSFGQTAYGIIREQLLLRERLKPYILEQMRLAHETGAPPMRPLFFDFPADETCWEVDDQFLFGPQLLVCPVLEEGACSRRVYLPAGATWRDAWSGEKLVGGQWIEAEAPLERIPVYLRGEADLPVKPRPGIYPRASSDTP